MRLRQRLWLVIFASQLLNLFFGVMYSRKIIAAGDSATRLPESFRAIVPGIFFLFLIGLPILVYLLRPEIDRRAMNKSSSSLASESTSAPPSVLSKVDSLLRFLQLFLPARIMKEDAGDAREVIDKLVAVSAPTWMIYTKLTSSVFWILLAAVREVLTVTKKKPN